MDAPHLDVRSSKSKIMAAAVGKLLTRRLAFRSQLMGVIERSALHMGNAEFREKKERFLVAPATRGWYVVCLSKELKHKPLRKRLMGMPIVLFRSKEGIVGALLDRCPHRNVPLSLGRVVEYQIECRYHGWQFDVCGNRVRVPGLCGRPEKKEGLVPSFPTREQDGFVWVYGTPGTDPKVEPFRVPERDSEGYATVYRVGEIKGSLFATVENALDVPHTAFLHRGLFRGTGEPQGIKAVITRYTDRIEVEYLGERPPKGLAARFLTSSEEIMTHVDRFILPSITQVEYRLGEKGHLTTFLCTPVEDFLTKVFAVFQFRMGLPAWLMKLLMTPVVKRVIRQDADMLKEQTETVIHFGEERFTSTELDVLGLQIWRLMRHADLGPSPTMNGSDGQAPGEGARFEIEIKI